MKGALRRSTARVSWKHKSDQTAKTADCHDVVKGRGMFWIFSPFWRLLVQNTWVTVEDLDEISSIGTRGDYIGLEHI